MRGANVTLYKAHYKGPNTGEDFLVYIHDYEEFMKWRGGPNKDKERDTTIPIVNFIGSYKIMKTDKHGSQGIESAPSGQELDSEFGKSKVEDVIEIILLADIGEPQRDGAPLRIEKSTTKERQGDRNPTKGPTGGH